MGKFFNDFLMGAGQAGSDILKEDAASDRRKSEFMDKMQELAQSEKLKGDIAVQKDNSIRQQKLDAVKSLVQTAAQAGTPYSQEDINDMNLSALGGVGSAIVKGKVSPGMVNLIDNNPYSPTYNLRIPVSKKDAAAAPKGMYLSDGTAVKPTAGELKEYRIDGTLLRDMYVLKQAFMAESEVNNLSDKQRAARTALMHQYIGNSSVDKGLPEDADGSILGPTGLVVGNMKPEQAALANPAGTAVRQFIEGSQLAQRWELFKSRYTEEAAQAAGHAFLDNKFTPAQTREKINQIIGMEIQPKVSADVKQLQNVNFMPSRSIEALLSVKYNPAEKDSDTLGFSSDFVSPDYSKMDKPVGEADIGGLKTMDYSGWGQTANPPSPNTATDRFANIPSPSATNSVNTLTSPSQVTTPTVDSGGMAVSTQGTSSGTGTNQQIVSPRATPAELSGNPAMQSPISTAVGTSPTVGPDISSRVIGKTYPTKLGPKTWTGTGWK